MKRTSFWGIVLEGLVGLHRIIQLQLLQHYWLGNRLGLLLILNGLPWKQTNKVGKTTRPFRYDLNQIPYDYRVEVRYRFKGPDLIDRVPDELWMEVCDIVQETGTKNIPMEKKCKKAKWLSKEAL